VYKPFSYNPNRRVYVFLWLAWKVPHVPDLSLLVVKFFIFESIDHLYRHRLPGELLRLKVRVSFFHQTFQRHRCLGRIVYLDLVVYSFEDGIQLLLAVTDGRARSSARSRYAQVKAFFNLLIEHGKITSNPCYDLMLRKFFNAPRYKDRDVVAREIVDEIICRCRKLRNRLIMELQARCGLCIGEVLKPLSRR
jgi:hypothetical protein